MTAGSPFCVVFGRSPAGHRLVVSSPHTTSTTNTRDWQHPVTGKSLWAKLQISMPVSWRSNLPFAHCQSVRHFRNCILYRRLYD